jgi:hypothetical protein
MSIKANISSGYRWRPGFFAIISLLFGVWFCYDGFVAWPRDKAIFEAYEQFTSEDRLSEWPAYAAEQGWPTDQDNPGKAHSELDLIVQRVISFILLLVGIAYLVGWGRTFGRWIALDDGELVTSWGVRVPLDQVTAMQLDRWQSKGIAVVQYQANGSTGRLVLDDWKYDREPTEQIVAAVREQLGMDEPAAE